MSSQYERELKKILQGDGWHVTKSGGSQGQDLVAYHPKWKKYVAIEEKSTSSEPYYLDAYCRNQWDGLLKLTQEGVTCYWFIRFKTGDRKDRWRAYFVNGPPYVLRREEGLTLEQFRERMCRD